MRAAALLAALEARGVRLMAVGQTLRVDAPRGVLTTADREALLAHKAAVLAALRAEASRASTTEMSASLTAAERDRLAAEAAGGDRLAQLVVEATACSPEPVAWRLSSRRLDRELWVARDGAAAAALDADGARAGLPVVLADDLERLRDFDDRRLDDLLDVLRHFPGARIAGLDPEAAS